MPCHHFTKPVKPLCCRCCDEPMLTINDRGGLQPLPGYRGVRFLLHGPNCPPQGAVSGPNVFCADCAKHPWTPTRLAALKKQRDDADALSDQGKRHQFTRGEWQIVNFRKPVDPITAHINRENRAALTLTHSGAEPETTIPGADQGPIHMVGPRQAVGAGVIGETVALGTLD